MQGYHGEQKSLRLRRRCLGTQIPYINSSGVRGASLKPQAAASEPPGFVDCPDV